MKVYVASSWRNEEQPTVVDWLRKRSHEVYDFRHPVEGNDGFSWSQIDPNWKNWTSAEYFDALRHPLCQHGFLLDFVAMNWADACVMVMPCGFSAACEFGWFCGQGKLAVVALFGAREPDMMIKMATGVALNLEQMAMWL